MYITLHYITLHRIAARYSAAVVHHLSCLLRDGVTRDAMLQ